MNARRVQSLRAFFVWGKLTLAKSPVICVAGVYQTSLSLLYSSARIQLPVLCLSTSVLSTSEILCLSQELPYLPPKTLYPFAENPRGFCQKPYTLFPGKSLPDGGRQGVCRQSGGCIRSGYARSSLHIFRYTYSVGSMRKTYRRMVCKNESVSWCLGFRKLRCEKVVAWCKNKRVYLYDTVL